MESMSLFGEKSAKNKIRGDVNMESMSLFGEKSAQEVFERESTGNLLILVEACYTLEESLGVKANEFFPVLHCSVSDVALRYMKNKSYSQTSMQLVYMMMHSKEQLRYLFDCYVLEQHCGLRGKLPAFTRIEKDSDESRAIDSFKDVNVKPMVDKIKSTLGLVSKESDLQIPLRFRGCFYKGELDELCIPEDLDNVDNLADNMYDDLLYLVWACRKASTAKYVMDKEHRELYSIENILKQYMKVKGYDNSGINNSKCIMHLLKYGKDILTEKALCEDGIYCGQTFSNIKECQGKLQIYKKYCKLHINPIYLDIIKTFDLGIE